jgi:hypothetical protein
MGIKLSRSQVALRYGNVSVRTIERWTRDPRLNFPQPVRFGHRSQLYDLDELRAWERVRIAEQMPFTAADDFDLAPIVGGAP